MFIVSSRLNRTTCHCLNEQRHNSMMPCDVDYALRLLISIVVSLYWINPLHITDVLIQKLLRHFAPTQINSNYLFYSAFCIVNFVWYAQYVIFNLICIPRWLWCALIFMFTSCTTFFYARLPLAPRVLWKCLVIFFCCIPQNFEIF